MFQNVKTAKWILASPLILFIILMVIFPAAYGVYLSLENVSFGNVRPTFQGLSNYSEILTDIEFWHTIGFTLVFTFVTTILELIFGFLLALLFNRVFPGKRILLSLILLPIMVAPSLMGIMFRLLLNENIGTATYILSLFHVQINLFAPDTIAPLLMVLDVIQWVPFTFLIIYSGLQGVNKGLYEAAAIDGASYWKTVFKVIVPTIKPIIIIAAFLRAIDAFRTFDVIYVLTNGGPGNASTTASIYIYKMGFKDGNVSLAAAASILIAIFLLIFLPFIIKRIMPTEN